MGLIDRVCRSKEESNEVQIRKEMSRIVLLILVLTGSGSIRAKDSPEPDPVIMIRSTLKTWRKMYNTYQEEMHLGYCWADYFLDIRKIIDGFAAPKVPNGLVLGPARKNILEDLRADEESDDKKDEYSTRKDPRQEYETSQDYEEENMGGSDLTGKWGAFDQEEENHDPAYQGSNYPVSLLTSNSEQHTFLGAEQSNVEQQGRLPYGFPSARSLDSSDPKEKYQPGHRSNSSSSGSHLGLGFRNVDGDGDAPGNRSAVEDEDEESRELLHSRGFGNLILSMLGLDAPGHVESSVYRVEPNPLVFTVVRFIGTFVRVGREVMKTIDSTSVLACTKDYLWGKMLHWIDS